MAAPTSYPAPTNCWSFAEQAAVPRHAAGVYTAWDEEERFIYVGMGGRAASVDVIQHWILEGSPPRGLWQHLTAHASGRRSGDPWGGKTPSGPPTPAFLSDETSLQPDTENAATGVLPPVGHLWL